MPRITPTISQETYDALQALVDNGHFDTINQAAAVLLSATTRTSSPRQWGGSGKGEAERQKIEIPEGWEYAGVYGWVQTSEEKDDAN